MSSTTTTTPDEWEDGIKLLFERIGDPLPVAWKEQGRDYTPDGVILLKVIADASQGIDEYRTVVNTAELTSSPPIEIEPTACGSSRVTLQVQVETFDQDGSRRARWMLRQIRLRLRWPSSLANLKVLETSLLDILSLPVVDRLRDNRQYSLATMDVRLNTIQIEADKPFGRIDKLGIQPLLSDEAGSPIVLPPFTINLPDP